MRASKLLCNAHHTRSIATLRLVRFSCCICCFALTILRFAFSS
jgi:hypothetical protein